MSIEVGAKLSGKVSGITDFGAFVDLGDKKTGLVHISEVSNT
ncbi:S1 RNA-binding domain-containing protein, partial [Ligilactobacillus salivarius]